MPSSPSAGPPGQRPRRRVLASLVALLAVLAVVAPFATPAVADAGGTAPATRSAAAPHGNVTDGSLTLLVGPSASYDALDEFGDVRTAHRAGALEREENVRVGDTLVLALRSDRLGAEYADTTGPNASVRFFEALDATNGSLAVTSLGETECGPVRVDPRGSRHRVLANASAGEFRLLLDTGALAADGGCDGELDVPRGYEVTARLPTANGTRRSQVPFDLLDAPEDPRPRPDPAGELPVYRGSPPVADDLRNATAVRRGIEEGRLRRTVPVVRGEVAVLEIESPRLARAYANASGQNATRRFLRAVNATGGYIEIVPRRADEARRTEGDTRQSGRRGGERDGVRLVGPGVRTLPAPGNGTFYLVLDTERARVSRGGRSVTLANATELALVPTLVVPGAEPERSGSDLFIEQPTGRVEIARNRSARGMTRAAVVGTDGRFVARVDTNLAAGSRVTVRVRADNETLASRDLRTGGERSVDQDAGSEPGSGPEPRSDAVAFDLGPLETDRTLTVTLVRDGAAFHRTDVVVGDPPTLRNPIVRRVGRGPEGTTVRFAVTARYPAPGYVVVQNASGRYIGFEVPGGEQVRVNGTVTLPPTEGREPRQVRLIAVHDTNRNGTFDGPRTEGATDQPFSSAEEGLLARTVRLAPPSPTPTVTAPPPGTTVAVEGGQPGFGVLAPLGALGAVALLARRR